MVRESKRLIDVRGTVFIRCAVTCNRASRSRRPGKDAARLRAAGLERGVVPPFGVQGKGEAPPFGVPPREDDRAASASKIRACKGSSGENCMAIAGDPPQLVTRVQASQPARGSLAEKNLQL